MAADSAPPREGLPPCKSQTIFDGRKATKIDRNDCPVGGRGHGATTTRFLITFGAAGTLTWSSSHCGYPDHLGVISPVVIKTDDKAEAEDAYARGCEFVLTGVLP